MCPFGSSVSVANSGISAGIHIVPTLHPNVTHHLTAKYNVTAPIATSLIAVATLVKPEWHSVVLNAGSAEEGELSSLEEHFVLPPTSKFRPSVQSSLPSRLKKYNLWEPDEECVGMFSGGRFIFVGEKGAEAPDVVLGHRHFFPAIAIESWTTLSHIYPASTHLAHGPPSLPTHSQSGTTAL